MATFALVDDSNMVVDVIKIADADCGGGVFPASEPVGQEFISSIGLTGNWLQTSINGSFRGMYGGVGASYDPATGTFSSLDGMPEPILAPAYQAPSPVEESA